MTNLWRLPCSRGRKCFGAGPRQNKNQAFAMRGPWTATLAGMILLSMGSDFCGSSQGIFYTQNKHQEEFDRFPCRAASMWSRYASEWKEQRTRITRFTTDGSEAPLSGRRLNRDRLFPRAHTLKLRGGSSGSGVAEDAAKLGQLIDCGRSNKLHPLIQADVPIFLFFSIWDSLRTLHTFLLFPEYLTDEAHDAYIPDTISSHLLTWISRLCPVYTSDFDQSGTLWVLGSMPTYPPNVPPGTWTNPALTGRVKVGLLLSFS